jgi:hypothetical protein
MFDVSHFKVKRDIFLIHNFLINIFNPLIFKPYMKLNAINLVGTIFAVELS